MSAVDEILPHLFVGNKNASTDLDLIAKMNLSHIVSVELIPLPQVVTSTFPNLAVLQIPVADSPESDLMSHFEVRNSDGKSHDTIVVMARAMIFLNRERSSFLKM